VATVQDSTHPTGVRADKSDATRPRGEVVQKRNRKADAALSLKMTGALWGEVAQALGYPTPRAAQLAAEKALVRQLATDDDRDKMRTMAGARLDRLLRAVWGKAINPNDPEQLSAISRSRELIADHVKLYGLAAPTEVVVHSPSQSDLEDWVLRMTATMVPDIEEADIFDAEVTSIEAS
jgi:hypothetical protein